MGNTSPIVYIDSFSVERSHKSISEKNEVEALIDHLSAYNVMIDGNTVTTSHPIHVLINDRELVIDGTMRLECNRAVPTSFNTDIARLFN